MKPLFYSLLFLSLLHFAIGCQSNNDVVKPPTTDSTATGSNGDDPNDDTGGNEGNEGLGSFVFTSRGEKVVCIPSQNGAEFQQDVNGHYILAISSKNQEVPEYHPCIISIEVNVEGKLHTGTFDLEGTTYLACVGGDGPCSEVGLAQTGVKGKQTDPKVLANGLQSASGTLKITDIEVGEFHLGFAEGYISGTFSFSGTELGDLGQHPGTASGKFEKIPLLVVQ